jgi:hypothetical protein|tara:strand:+ start:13 stop:984 length:972 start_codon:yes stop_codon:yes gene_type:complete
MAYQAGDTILDDEYNTFVTSSSDPFGYNHFAGTGSTVYGLGQTELQAVTGGSTTIAASHWNGLITGMINIANHTNDSLTARTAVAAGDTIAIKSAIAADLATLAASVAAGSPNATALTTSSALQTVTTASEGWDSTATHEVRATFANGNNARFFFNAGGKLRINVDTVAAATSDKDTAFADLGTAIGNLDIASLATTRSGSGETLTTDGLARGFQDLTTSYQTIIKLTSDNSNYDSNFIEISAKTEGGNGNSGDATAVTIKMVASDAAADTQFQSSNLSSAPVDVKDTPKMRTKLISITPNTDQGLGTAYGLSATSTESNSTS